MRVVTLALCHVVLCTPVQNESSMLASALSALVNVAVFPRWHQDMKSILHKVYSFLDGKDWNVDGCSFQSLRLLINLSCNQDMIPSLLAAQVQ